jgi:hypothetical protein
MPGELIEDIIAETAAEERKRAPAFTFAAIYAFVANAAHSARGQERQVILDAITKARVSGHNKDWNAGYDAAITAVIRVLVERSFTH